jgi:putative hydrolase of the HAD superfamily
LRTALLSNSWGGTEYPRADFPHLFDAVVISSECGMRKPEAEIFRHAADLLGLPPEQCIFIDDIEANIAAAQACGMTGVHHVEAAQTAAALEDLLGLGLAEPASSAGPDARPATVGPGVGPATAGPDAGPATGNTMR